MERTLDSTAISEAILSAPGWARVGIIMPDPHIRERSAQELALSIVEAIEKDILGQADQLTLPL